MKYAFTLAELLVAMTIIGVIAVLTVPNVSRNVFERANKVKLKTTYETLATSLRTMMVNEHVSSLEDTTFLLDSDGAETYFEKYLNGVKDCSPMSDCFGNPYKTPDKTTSISFINSSGCQYGVILNTSAALCHNFYSSSQQGFWVDVNGTESPNVWGKDLFLLVFNEKGELDLSDLDDEPTCDYTGAQIASDLWTTSLSCTVSILSGEI